MSLTDQERIVLAGARERLSIEWRVDGSVTIGPREGYVGSIELSADTLVIVRPKVPVAQLLLLVGLAYRTDPIPPTFGQAALDTATPVDWLAVLLIAQIEALIAEGVRQGYVLLEQQIPFVRGRIRVAASAVAAWARPGLVSCEYTDFLPDTPENRILRGTLEALSVNRLHPGVRGRLADLLGVFSQVSYIRVSTAMFERLQLNRLNRHYRPALELCRLFAEAAGLDVEPGQTRARAFFFPMERIFETAVANYLLDRVTGLRIQPSFGGAISHVGGGPPLPISINPDLVIKQNGRPILVVDTKYKKPIIIGQFQRQAFRNADIYQIATYAHGLQTPGVLIYPRVDVDVDVLYEVGGLSVRLLSVDLSLPDLKGLEALAQAVHPADIPPGEETVLDSLEA
jgi:5-methylcytosine-specific restriction enzyme subunit McrC